MLKAENIRTKVMLCCLHNTLTHHNMSHPPTDHCVFGFVFEYLNRSPYDVRGNEDAIDQFFGTDLNFDSRLLQFFICFIEDECDFAPQTKLLNKSPLLFKKSSAEKWERKECFIIGVCKIFL